MRLTIIDEVGLRTKDDKGLIRGLNIQQIEISDKLLQDFKTAYELWLEEKTKEELKPLKDMAEASSSKTNEVKE